jgi:hypothetical protein
MKINWPNKSDFFIFFKNKTMRHISDSERILQASYKKKLEEIKTLNLKLWEYREQLLTMKNHVTELSNTNKILCEQISNLVSKQKQNAN